MNKLSYNAEYIKDIKWFGVKFYVQMCMWTRHIEKKKQKQKRFK